MKNHLLICVLVSTLTLGISCSKKQEDVAPGAENAAMEQEAAPAQEPAAAAQDTPEQAPEEKTDVKPDAPRTELDILKEKAASKSTADVENVARYLFNDEHSDFDYVQGCQALRAIEVYDSAEMTYRRGWCDELQGRTELSAPLLDIGLRRIRQAADMNHIPALQHLIDDGSDTDMSAFRKLTDIYKKQLEENKTPESEYNYASILMSMPGEPPQEAIELLKSAAQASYPPAQRKLGQYYDSDEAKRREGRELLEKAALAGDTEAMTTLISGFDFAARTATEAEDRDRNTEFMLHWCEKTPGQLLTCRVLLETATSNENAKHKEIARNNLVTCIEALGSDRWRCDSMKGFVERSTEFATLPDELRSQVKESLIHCYENVIRHGDAAPAIMNRKSSSNAEIIAQLRSKQF